jgi:hypothetical protein
MTKIMNGEAAPVSAALQYERAVFDAAMLPDEYLQSLPRSELLDLARYYRKMAEALAGSDDKRQQFAWLTAVSQLASMSCVSQERPPTSPLDFFIDDEIMDVCNYGNGCDDEGLTVQDFIAILRGDRFKFFDEPDLRPDKLMPRIRKIVTDKLRENGPMAWNAIADHVLGDPELFEESVPLHEAYFEMTRAGVIETSTPDVSSWSTMVRLPDEAAE